MPRTGHVAAIRRSVGSQRLLLPSVAICILDAQDRLLLVRHADGDRWAPPGGAIEPDESPADAAVRECFEETGLHVRPVGILGVYGGAPCQTTYANGDVVQYVLSLFRCEIVAGELVPDGREIVDARFVGPDDWQELTVPAWVRIALPRLFEDIAAGSHRAAFTAPTWQPDLGATTDPAGSCGAATHDHERQRTTVARPAEQPEQTPLVLRGELVLLEPMTVDHADELLALGAALAPSAPFTTVPASASAVRRYIADALAQFAAGRSVPFVCRDLSQPTHALVGTTRFLDVDVWDPPAASNGCGPNRRDPARWRPDGVEIGSTLFATDVQGRGHNTEAKLLMLDFAFTVWEVERVTLLTDARNAGSRRAIEKLGASFDGVRRADRRGADGSVRDSASYSILRAEWPELRPALQAQFERQRTRGT